MDIGRKKERTIGRKGERVGEKMKGTKEKQRQIVDWRLCFQEGLGLNICCFEYSS